MTEAQCAMPARPPVVRPVLTCLLLMTALCAAAPAAAGECEDTVRMDGLFSQARRACSFSYYAFRFQQLSQACRERLGTKEWQRLFSAGVSAFDANAARRGKRPLCDKLARDFPMTVKY